MAFPGIVVEGEAEMGAGVEAAAVSLTELHQELGRFRAVACPFEIVGLGNGIGEYNVACRHHMLVALLGANLAVSPPHAFPLSVDRDHRDRLADDDPSDGSVTSASKTRRKAQSVWSSSQASTVIFITSGAAHPWFLPYGPT